MRKIKARWLDIKLRNIDNEFTNLLKVKKQEA
jgi:hypothetical protein